MIEMRVFFFEVKASDGSTHAAHVKAPDLVRAKDCIERYPNVVSAKQ
jgi:hypothetical protein